MTTYLTIKCDVCGEDVEYREGAKEAACRNRSHVKPGFYHPINVAGGTECPRCKGHNGPLTSVYVTAIDMYEQMCGQCKSADAKRTAWLYSGMAQATRQALPPEMRA